MEQTTQTPQGRGMAIAGFVIALVALVFGPLVWYVSIFSAALGGGLTMSIFWLVFSIISVFLSVFGMIRLSKTNGNKGFGIAGMIIGILAILISVVVVFYVVKLNEFYNTSKLFENMSEAFENSEFKSEMEKATQEMENEFNNTLDSLPNSM